MNSKITKRILDKLNYPSLIKQLVDNISLSDFESLLLEIYRRKIKKLNTKHLTEQYLQNRFVQIPKLHPQTNINFEQF